jgi:hypothetical protein
MSHRIVIHLAHYDCDLLEPIRKACDAACQTRPELRHCEVRILRTTRRKAPRVTTVRGTSSEAIRVLMNVVYDVTGAGVSGDLING